MARPIRVEFTGAVYHVTARGNERRTIYRSEDDRRQFLRVLEQTVHDAEQSERRLQVRVGACLDAERRIDVARA